MSFNGSGTFVINSAGQPVVANTVISATVFNALTADLATGLSTCITKDGQTTVTANIPFGNNKITALGAGTAASDAANLGQVQSTAAKLVTVTGTDTITGTMSPALTAYAAGQLFYFIANAANTGAVTINIDGLGAKSITRDGSTALAGGDINSGEFVVIIYDGTRFQMINAANSFGNTTINGTLTVTGNTALQANVSITSTLSVGGTFAVTGAATLGSTLAVTGKSDLPTVSTASINAAVALITTGTVTNLTASGASIASANIGNLQFTAASIASINAGVAVITNLTATSASIASVNAGVALLTTATITGLTATGASVASANVGTAVVTGMTVTGASIASVNAGVAVLSVNPTLSGGTANGVLYLNGSKVATSGSALTFDGTGKFGVGTATPVGGVSSGFEAVGEIWAATAASNANQIRLSPSTSGANIIYSTYAGSGSYLPLAFNVSGSEQMRLTSTGLGIGTTSPTHRLTIGSGSYTQAAASSTTGMYTTATGLEMLSDSYYFGNRSGTNLAFLNSSGNLGLGVTPSAWASSRALQVGNASVFAISNVGFLGANAYYDGSYKYIAGGTAQVLEVNNSNEFRFLTATSGSAGGTISFTQAMTLDANGDLGIGTTSVPSGGASTRNVSIHNSNSATTYLKLSNGATGNTASDGFDMIMGTSSDVYLYNRENGPMIFGTNNAERARISAAGEFLVGTTDITPNAGIGVKAIPAGQLHLVSNASTTSSDGFTMYSTGAAAYRFYVQWNGTINATNTTITGISDQRLKENIQDLNDGLDAILALKPRKFDWKEGKGKDIKGDRGWIAQEFEQVFPDMISEWKEPAPEGEEPYKAVRADLIPVLVKAMQEQQAMIEELKAKVAQLEAR